MITKTYYPGVDYTITDNSVAVDLPSGLLYAGLFKSDRGPASQIYNSNSQFSEYCGLENPTTSLGVGSINDILLNSTNVLGIRILRPYDETTQTGDSYAYVVYNNKEGWVAPTGVAPYLHLNDPYAYVFQSDEAFIVTSLAQGSYYNSISVSLSYDESTQSYTMLVLNANGTVLETYVDISFTISPDGSNMANFVENVINGNSAYITVVANYSYLISIGGQLDPSYFSIVNNISLSQLANAYTPTSQFIGFSEISDGNGNIYIVGGYNHSSSSIYDITTETAKFNTTVFQYNIMSGTWLALPNNAPLFNNVTYSMETITPVSFYHPANGGSIYFISTNPEDQTVQLFNYSLVTYSWTNLGTLETPVGFLNPAGSIVSSILMPDLSVLITLTDPLNNVYLWNFDYVTNTISKSVSLTTAETDILATGNTLQNRAPELFNYNGQLYLFNQSNSGIYQIDPTAVFTAGGVTLVTLLPNLVTATNEFANMWIQGSSIYFLAPTAAYDGSYLLSYDFITSQASINLCNVDYTNCLLYTYDSGGIPTKNYTLFQKPSLGYYSATGISFVMGTLGFTAPTTGTTVSAVIMILNSLKNSSNLYLGTDLPIDELTDADITAALVPLFNKKDYPGLDVLCDCGFNSVQNILAMNQLCFTRQDCVHIASMPAQYMRNAKSAVQFRLSLGLNNGYTFLATPGYYVRPNNYNGVLQLFPISGAITSSCALNDNNNGPWQPPAGYNYGNLPVVTKLPPQNPSLPLVVNYKEITYSLSELEYLSKNQVNIVGRYSPVTPGVYLQTDYMMTTKNSLLQSLSIFRTVLYISSQAAARAIKLLFEPNDTETQAKAYVMYNTWLKIIAAAPGALTAYQVVCDSSNNPNYLVDNNILSITINLLPPSLVKFVKLNIVVNNLESSVNISFSQ